MTQSLLIVLVALLVVLVAAVVFLIVGQLKTLRALADMAATLQGLSEDVRREGVPLLHETRATVAAATETLRTAQEATRAAQVAAESLQALGPLIQRLDPVVDGARIVVAHADSTVVEARATIGTAQRVLAQVEVALGKMRLTDLAMEVVKQTGGEAGHLAASVGQLVKSVWRKRPERADGGPQESPDGPEARDDTKGTATPDQTDRPEPRHAQEPQQSERPDSAEQGQPNGPVRH